MPESNDWFSEKMDPTRSIAWGDVDGDGDLDLAVGNKDQDQIYLNKNGVLCNSNWEPDEDVSTTSVAWGDIDGDGDLDLAVGTNERNLIYLNEPDSADTIRDDVFRCDKQLDIPSNKGKLLQDEPRWRSDEDDNTLSIAWGDVDGDGDLDLAVGNGDSQANRLYENDNGILQTIAIWSSTEEHNTSSVAWADVDNDGDLDLAFGNQGQSNQVYINNGGRLEDTASWSSSDSDDTRSIVWGDIDRDGALDLVSGNFGGTNRLYQNDGSRLQEGAVWSSSEENGTLSIALGDLDKDGDLDLIVGNSEHNKIYMNTGEGLQDNSAWSSLEEDMTKSIALADIDGDGDLDLATGNDIYDDEGQPNRVYLNPGTVLLNRAEILKSSGSKSAAWGDVDNDGDLDLMLNSGLYLNESGRLADSPTWKPDDEGDISSIAWGDIDNDGDLDLNLIIKDEDKTSQLYRNIGGTLETSPIWTSDSIEDAHTAVWGDIDSDGDLDLMIGIRPDQSNDQDTNFNQLYLNEGGILKKATDQASKGYGHSISWGDTDQDGDIDLVTVSDKYVKFYSNKSGELSLKKDCRLPNSSNSDLQPDSGCQSPNSTSSALGDLDGDGILDLVIGKRGKSNQVYLNSDISSDVFWSSSDTDFTESVALGDVDGDGDLDLAAGNSKQPNRLYLNHNGTLQPDAVWSSAELSRTVTIAWGDVDNDGDLDLFAGNSSDEGADMVDHLYLNMRQDPSTGIAISAATPHHGMANFYSQSRILTNTLIPLTYTLYSPTDTLVGTIQAEYSPDGGGQWFPAIAAKNTITQGLAAAPDGTPHVYTWDTFASNFFGRSDNVVIRMVAHAQSSTNNIDGRYKYTNTAPGTIQQAYASSISYPFRVQGTLIRVYEESSDPNNVLPNTIVYQIPANKEVGERITDNTGKPFSTNANGYLQGRGRLSPGNRLVALALLAETSQYKVYQTNLQIADNTENESVYGTTVTEYGVQKIIVSKSTPLILFDFSISLEWDARKDNVYLQQLREDMELVSELLYDVTNGQAALSQVKIYHARERWNEADLRIYATNRLRPRATIGGLNKQLFAVTLPITETQSVDGTEISTVVTTSRVYLPGQIHMPATWNRAGELYGNQGEDWPRTLVHELGHYFFYLLENYLGVEDNLPKEVTTCPGIMGNVYLPENSELHPEIGWLDDCHETLQHEKMGRSDWETITTFYPWLIAPVVGYKAQNQGPARLPLDITDIEFVKREFPPRTLDVATYYLVNQDNSRYEPSSSARAYLFKRNPSRIIDLGEPRRDRLQVWGTELIDANGDRICVYDLGQTTPMSGCQDVTKDQEQLAMYKQSDDWTPQAIVTAITANALEIEVTGIALSEGETLYAQLYPAGNDERSAQSAIELSITEDEYTGIFKLINPPLEGRVHIWIDEEPENRERENLQRREAMFDYILNGSYIFKLKDAIDFSLSNESSLILSDGSIITLTGVYTASGNNNSVTLNDKSTLNLSEKTKLTWANYITTTLIMVLNGDMSFENLDIEDGDKILFENGELLLSKLDGSSFMLSDGTSFMLSDGTTLIFNANSLILDSGGALILSEGSSLTLSDGVSFMLSDGTSFMLSDGTTILEQIGLEDGDSLVSDTPARTLELSNSSNFIIYNGEAATIFPNGGLVQVFGEGPDLESNQFYSIQSVVNLPQAPPWATLAGEAYRLTTSGDFQLSDNTISIRYFGRDVLSNEEEFLSIYYYNYDTEIWTPLETNLIREQNLAVAGIESEGIYVLMSSIPIPLNGLGWNFFGYPTQTSRPVVDALSHIDDRYDAVYHYESIAGSGQWQRYSPNVPDYVNNLGDLEHNKVYWINMLDETDLQIKGNADPSNLLARSDRSTGQLPPSTFYGQVTGNSSFTPIEGMAVIATIDEVECGRGVIERIINSPDTEIDSNTDILSEKIFLPLVIAGANINSDQTLVYVVDVNSAGTDYPKCGRQGDDIRFSIESEQFLSYPTVKWDNNLLQERDLGTPTSILDAETAPEPPINQNR